MKDNFDVRATPNVTDIANILYGTKRNVSKTDHLATVYVIEKSLRISATIMTVCDMVERDSPLGQSLEKTSIGLTELSSRVSRGCSNRFALVGTLHTLTALLTTGALHGSIATRTADILVNELRELTLFIKTVDWAEGASLLDTRGLETPLDESAYRTPEYTQPQTTDKRHVQVSYTTPVNTSNPYTKKDIQQESSTTTPRVSEHYKERVQEIQKDRRATILALLQKKDKVSVRDVANVIKDCSDKTIQRELLALVRQGVLVKEGERRWSTYRLA